jgi:trimeric autotransporter adhesin
MKNLRQMIKNAVLFCMSVVLTFGITYGQYTADQVAGGGSILRLPSVGNPAHVDDAFNIGIPGPLAVAPNGDIAWADYWDGNLMYWNSTTDVIEMLIASGSAMEGMGGPIANAINGGRISGITFDSDNNIWYTNSNRVLKVDMTTRTLHHIAGSGLAGTPDFSLPMEEANLNGFGIAFNHDESILYVNLLGANMVAALHLATSQVEHIAGTGSQTDGIPAGLALLSNIRQPFGLDYVKDPEGVEWLYIASQQKMVYSVNLNTGILYPFAGTGSWNQSGDGGLATAATLLQPHDIVVDATNTYVYFGDHQGNHHGVRRVNVKTGIIDRYTGIHNSPDRAIWLEGAYDDPAKRVGHRLEIPTDRAVGVDLDNDGNLIVGTRSPLLFKVNVTTDQMELIAGYKASPPPLDGPGTAGVQATAMAIEAWGVVTKDGKPYFFDVTSRKIVRLEDDGTTTVIAGNGESAFVGNATLATAQFNAIRYMIFDKDGNIYASDFGHHAVYKIDLVAETVTVVAGTGASGMQPRKMVALLPLPDLISLMVSGSIPTSPFSTLWTSTTRD